VTARMRFRTYSGVVLCCSLIFLLPQDGLSQANGYHFIRTDQDPASVLYDFSHQQFFVSVPAANEVVAISAIDGGVLGSISVPSASEMDLSPDGNTLYVAGNTGMPPYATITGFFVIDTTSLRVVGINGVALPLSPSATVNGVLDQRAEIDGFASMANGKLFYWGYGYFGSSVYQYDLTTGGSTNTTPPLGGAALIAKSSNGRRFVTMAGAPFSPVLWVYDSDTDSFTASSSVPAISIEENLNGLTLTFDPTGTRILVDSHYLLDQDLNFLMDIWPNEDSLDCAASTFSPDGTRIYCLGGSLLPGIVRVFDTATGAILGDVAGPPPPSNQSLIAVSSTGLAVLLGNRGCSVLDVNSPSTNLGSTGVMLQLSPSAGQPNSPALTFFELYGTMTASTANLLSTSKFFFGKATGSVVAAYPQSGPPEVTIQPPPGSAGPVDVSQTPPAERVA
jgi:hypothetical protein